jgi:DNA polymerase elongation subunit (family B)
MIELIDKGGGESIEADTDGVICTVPDNTSPSDFCSTIQEELSEFPYIHIDPEPRDHVIEKLYMYSNKNYAYYDGDKLKIFGSALRSKAKPPIFKEFIKKGLKYILDEKEHLVIELYEKLSMDIKLRKVSIDQICKTMRLGKSMHEYLEKKSKKLAHFEVWVNVGELDKVKGTSTTHYKSECEKRYKLNTEYDDDYDIKYYLNALKDTLNLLIG